MNYNVKSDNWIDLFDYVVDASLGHHTLTSYELETIRYRMKYEKYTGELAPLWSSEEFLQALEILEEANA